ncbi:hypothetical protein FOXG_01390 [Fusarium oxysporum f. sp. lycopersici 4287]|uniref:Uncharacterized protein n=2 Tax=Fusarium oxysporum TaxID=5507 RepID=A0A0J9UAJ0_FUSO4|nr:hypothetical protein FOXG_01390 [Fusarium oxysporum f. sp. lycopersici 4287]KNA96034.1 hypothetical protein FOXG_01390 [Fusarium oxysporum f. sp. lycopersici 4287]
MAMYDSMNSTDHLVKHDVHQVPPGFSGGFSRILTQLQILVGNYESQPVTILTCLYRLQGCNHSTSGQWLAERILRRILNPSIILGALAVLPILTSGSPTPAIRAGAIHVRGGWIPVVRRSRSSRADDDQCSASEFDDMGEEEVPIGGDDAEYWGPKESHEDDRDISELGPKKLCFWYF